MQVTTITFYLLLAGSAVWAARRYRRSDALAAEDRLAGALLPVVYVCLFAVYCGRILSMPFDDWNAARLAPVMALRYGYGLYYPPEDGPILGMLYGPMTAVAYLPALVATTPTTAILIAGSLGVAFVTIPLGILCFATGATAGWSRSASATIAEANRGTPLAGWSAGHVGFVFGLAALLLHESTEYIATSIHADAPAVGFGLLACIVIMGAWQEEIGARRLVGAGILAIFAAFSKQFEVTLVIGLAAYLAVRFGTRSSVGFLLTAAAVGAVLTALFGFLWGFEAIAQSTVILPLRHPRREWIHVASDSYDWLKHGAAVGLIVLFGLLVSLHRSRRAGYSGWGVLVRSPAGVLVFAILALVPASLASVARFGAEANSNHWMYFLIGAASLLLSRAAKGPVNQEAACDLAPNGSQGEPEPRDLPPSLFALFRRASYVAAAGAVCLVLPELYRLRRAGDLQANPARQAYVFARNHRRAAYFPWHPLSTLMADGKAYHFEYGVFDRDLVGAGPSAAHFQDFLPSGLRYVVLRGERERTIALTRRYLPAFSHRATLPDLPGWTVFTRADASSGK